MLATKRILTTDQEEETQNEEMGSSSIENIMGAEDIKDAINKELEVFDIEELTKLKKAIEDKIARAKGAKSSQANELISYASEERIIDDEELKEMSDRYIELKKFDFEELDDTEQEEMAECKIAHEKYMKKMIKTKVERNRLYWNNQKKKGERFLKLRERFHELTPKELLEYKECEKAVDYLKKQDEKVKKKNSDLFNESYKRKSRQEEIFNRRLAFQGHELNEKELEVIELEECEEVYQKSNKIIKLRESDKISFQETITTQTQILLDHVKQIFALEKRIDQLNDSELKELKELKSLGDINDLEIPEVSERAKQVSINQHYTNKAFDRAALYREEVKRVKQEMQEPRNRFNKLSEEELEKLREIDKKNQELNNKNFRQQKESEVLHVKRFNEFQSRINDEIVELEENRKTSEFHLKSTEKSRQNNHRRYIDNYQRKMKRMNELKLHSDQLTETESEELEELERTYEKQEKEKLRNYKRRRIVNHNRKVMVQKILHRNQKLRLVEMESQVNNLDESELEDLIKEKNQQQLNTQPELNETKRDLVQKSSEFLDFATEKQRNIELKTSKITEGQNFLRENEKQTSRSVKIRRKSSGNSKKSKIVQEDELVKEDFEELKLLRENIQKRGRKTSRKLLEADWLEKFEQIEKQEETNKKIKIKSTERRKVEKTETKQKVTNDPEKKKQTEVEKTEKLPDFEEYTAEDDFNEKNLWKEEFKKHIKLTAENTRKSIENVNRFEKMLEETRNGGLMEEDFDVLIMPKKIEKYTGRNRKVTRKPIRNVREIIKKENETEIVEIKEIEIEKIDLLKEKNEGQLSFEAEKIQENLKKVETIKTKINETNDTKFEDQVCLKENTDLIAKIEETSVDGENTRRSSRKIKKKQVDSEIYDFNDDYWEETGLMAKDRKKQTAPIIKTTTIKAPIKPETIQKETETTKIAKILNNLTKPSKPTSTENIDLRKEKRRIRDLENRNGRLNEKQMAELESLKSLVEVKEREKRRETIKKLYWRQKKINVELRERANRLTEEELKKLEELKEQLKDNKLKVEAALESETQENLKLLDFMEKRRKRMEWRRGLYLKRKKEIAEYEARIQELTEEELKKLEVLRFEFIKKYSNTKDRTIRMRKRKSELETRLHELNEDEKKEFEECEKVTKRAYNQYKKLYERRKKMRADQAKRVAELEERQEELTEEEVKELNELKATIAAYKEYRRRNDRRYRDSKLAKIQNAEETKKASTKTPNRKKKSRSTKPKEEIKTEENPGSISQKRKKVEKIKDNVNQSAKNETITLTEAVEQKENQDDNTNSKENQQTKHISELENRIDSIDELYVEEYWDLDPSCKAPETSKSCSSYPQTLNSEGSKSICSSDEEHVIDETDEIESLLNSITKQLTSSKPENLCALKCLIKEQKNNDFASDGINVLHQIQIYSNKANEVAYENIRIRVSDTLLHNIRQNLTGTKEQNICALNMLLSDLQKIDFDDDSDSDCEMQEESSVGEGLKNNLSGISLHEREEETECDATIAEDVMYEEIVYLDD